MRAKGKKSGKRTRGQTRKKEVKVMEVKEYEGWEITEKGHNK